MPSRDGTFSEAIDRPIPLMTRAPRSAPNAGIVTLCELALQHSFNVLCYLRMRGVTAVA